MQRRKGLLLITVLALYIFSNSLAVQALESTDIAKQANANSSNFEQRIIDAIAEAKTDSEIGTAQLLGLVPPEMKDDLRSAITRGNFAKLLIRAITEASGVSKSDIHAVASLNSAFSDTTDADVRACAELGIIDGFPDGTFSPNEQLTREQAAKMLAITATILGYRHESVNEATEELPPDVIERWSAGYVMQVTDMHNPFIAGRNPVMALEGDNFKPLAACTAEEAVQSVFRLLCAVSNDKTHYSGASGEIPEKDLTGYNADYEWEISDSAAEISDTDGKWIRANGTGVLYIGSGTDSGFEYIIHASAAGGKTAYTLTGMAMRYQWSSYKASEGLIFEYAAEGELLVRTDEEWRLANPGRSIPDGRYYLVQEKRRNSP